MKLSRTELRILKEVTRGNRSISEIAQALGKSKSQIYRSGNKLIRNGMVLCLKGLFEPVREAYVNLLLQLLGSYGSLIEPFSGSGLKVLTALLEPKSIGDLMQETKLGRAQVFNKIQQAKAISLVRHESGKYFLNDKLWGLAIDFLRELKVHEETVDLRVPADAVIYFKNEKEIVFSSKESLDASLTGFSVFEHYGIRVLTSTNYYYLPKRKLGKKDVFRHSLLIAEKEREIRQVILLALLYVKHKESLTRIMHPLVDSIKKILAGQSIPGYPKFEEINDRAEVYGIKLKG